MTDRLGSPRARLFVALDLAAETRRALAGWRDDAIADHDELRAVPPPALHVTLVFLGYRPETDVPRIEEVLFAALEGHSPPRLAARALVGVPRRRPRLFALELEGEDGGAAALQSAAATSLAAAGFYRPERRPFWPHLTLARVKRGARSGPLEAEPPEIGTFEAAEVTLYQSLLRPWGAVYEPLARLGLG